MSDTNTLTIRQQLLDKLEWRCIGRTAADGWWRWPATQRIR